MSLSKQVILDTSVVVGLVDSRDVWHNAAVALRDALKVVQAETVYFDCVINEAIGALARRAKERKCPSEFTDDGDFDYIEWDTPPFIPLAGQNRHLQSQDHENRGDGLRS